MLLERLLYVLAGQIGGVLSSTGIGHDLDGTSQPTLNRYVSYLEKTFMIFRLFNYGGSEAQVQRRDRKLYFLDGLYAGAFVEGLEHAADVRAVVGKPAAEFFATALRAIDTPAEAAVMVGDDIESDVAAAASRPDHVLDSFAELPELFDVR